ncbi:hypothetical protein [Nocardia asteroides]|uniref:hypothetical protein n=1 Tax=Nocardia asteroides TaxID=1824 RepID=UPI0033D555F4
MVEHRLERQLWRGDAEELVPPLRPDFVGEEADDHIAPYAQRLRDAGVPVSSTRYPGVFHGFFTEVTVFAQAGQAVDEVCRYLRGRIDEDIDTRR